MNEPTVPIFVTLLNSSETSRHTTLKGLEAAKEIAATLQAYQGETLPVVAIALATNLGIIMAGHTEETRPAGIALALQIISQLAAMPEAADMMRKPT